VFRYRTEIVVPADRYVCLQLPAHLPEGRATVVVSFPDLHQADGLSPPDEPDREDIEWWEEFEDDRDVSSRG
jgi:hypothetical protein